MWDTEMLEEWRAPEINGNSREGQTWSPVATSPQRESKENRKDKVRKSCQTTPEVWKRKRAVVASND